MKIILVYLRIAIIIFIMLFQMHSSQGANNTSLGIGIITNTNTRASESFIVYQIFSKLSFKDPSNKKIEIQFADNPSQVNYYINGEISHYIRKYENAFLLPTNITVINNRKFKDYSYSCIGYITIFKIQLWNNAKFVESFIDSALYIPSTGEVDNESINFDNYPGFYDESYKLYSPMLLNLFKSFSSLWNVNVFNLKNGEIFKFDIKQRPNGKEYELSDFLPSKHVLTEKSSIATSSFNFYFENEYTTVTKNELFFLKNYGPYDLIKLVALIAYPKTCWKGAVDSYIKLGNKYYSENDMEGFNMANWSALILSNQIKDKMTNIYMLKRTSLANILMYSQKENYTNYSDLLKLLISLIDGFLNSDYCKSSDDAFDKIFAELEKTFSTTQKSMNDLRKQNRFNSVTNVLALGAMAGGVIIDNKNGVIDDPYSSTPNNSSLANSLKDMTLNIWQSNYNSMNQTKIRFYNIFDNLDISIPISVIQFDKEDKVNAIKPFLFLECIKLIYIDKKNEYWQSCYQSFCSAKPKMLEDFLQIKKADTNLNSEEKLKVISSDLLNFEKYSYLKEKLLINE